MHGLITLIHSLPSSYLQAHPQDLLFLFYPCGPSILVPPPCYQS